MINLDGYSSKLKQLDLSRVNRSLSHIASRDCSFDYDTRETNFTFFTEDQESQERCLTSQSQSINRKSILQSVMQRGQLMTTHHKIKPHGFSKHSNINPLKDRLKVQASVTNSTKCDQSQFKAKKLPHFEIPHLIYKSQIPLTVPKEFKLSYHKIQYQKSQMQKPEPSVESRKTEKENMRDFKNQVLSKGRASSVGKPIKRTPSNVEKVARPPLGNITNLQENAYQQRPNSGSRYADLFRDYSDGHMRNPCTGLSNSKTNSSFSDIEYRVENPRKVHLNLRELL